MTRFRYYTATTLDGFLADDEDSLAWLFEQPEPPESAGPGPNGSHEDLMAGTGAMVMGATTYAWVRREIGDAEWPYEIPCFVFTHRDLAPAGEAVRIVSGPPAELAEEIRQAAAGRDVWVVGGGALAADLAEAGMLDELVLSIAPVTLGSGRPLLPRPFDLRLVHAAAHGPFVQATYEVVGRRA